LGEAKALSIEIPAGQSVGAFIVTGTLVTEHTGFATGPCGQITHQVSLTRARGTSEAIVIAGDALSCSLVAEEALGARHALGATRRGAKASLIPNRCTPGPLSKRTTLIVSLTWAAKSNSLGFGLGHIAVDLTAVAAGWTGIDHGNDHAFVSTFGSAGPRTADEPIPQHRAFLGVGALNGDGVDTRPPKTPFFDALQIGYVRPCIGAGDFDPVDGVCTFLGRARA